MKNSKYLFTIIIFLIVFIQGSSQLFAQGFAEVFSGSIPPVFAGSTAWGDYDNDGKLDILITGQDTSFLAISRIYRNTGSGFSQVYAGSLLGVQAGSGAWGDYDNDGKLDILLTGLDNSGNPVAKIYHNTGTGFTEVFGGSLTGVGSSTAAWGDYDNDGKLDILLTGTTDGSPAGAIAKIYHNTGSGFTEVFPGSLYHVAYSSVAWGDYDNDGKLDILLAGQDTSNSYASVTKIYHNTGNGFTEMYEGSLMGVNNGSVAWGDYDNDGDLDIVVTGSNGTNFGSDGIAKIYQNTGSGFTEVFAGALTGVMYSSVAWGDFDNDGDLDILLSGNTGPFDMTEIYKNDGNGFSKPFDGSLTGFHFSSVAWGDYGNDGYLDFVVTGYNNFFAPISQIIRITGSSPNTAPSSPSGLTATRSGTDVRFKWNRATDTQTPSSGLTYNLRIGTTANGINSHSPMANVSTGFRRVARFGNTNQDTSWTVKNLDTNGTYYWSVQAVDNAFAGSAFGTEQQFLFNAPVTYTLTYTTDGHGTINGTTPQTVNSHANGTSVTAEPFVGYHFGAWSDGSFANPRTELNVTHDTTVQAIFLINTYILTLHADHGTVLVNPPQTNFNHGDQVTLTATTANQGYYIDVAHLWSGDTSGFGHTASPTFTMTGNRTVTATFSILTYTLTYTAGAHGTLNGQTPQTVNYGTSGTTVTALANTGYHFVNWSDGYTSSSRQETNVRGDTSVTANFAINTYTLTYNAGLNGTINGSSPQTVNYLEKGTAVTAIGNNGYEFINWSDASTSNPRIDSNVTANITVTANFDLLKYTLTTDATDGSISVGPDSDSYTPGTIVELTAVPDDGYHFVEWSGDLDGSDNPATLTMDGDKDVTANFAQNAAVVEISPAQQELAVSPSSNIEVTFTVPMDETSFDDAISFIVTGSASGRHSGTFSYNDADSIVSFDPDIDFMKGEVVTVDVSSNITNTDAQSVVPFISQFTIGTDVSPGTFADKVDYATGSGPTVIYAADINNDGYVDIVTAQGFSSNTISVLKNNGNGTFAAKIDYTTGDTPKSVYAVDIDGDGFVDILVANAASNNVSVLKNNGDGTFAAKADYTAGQSPQSVYAADIDGDGDVDILIGNLNSDSINVLKNNGNGTFATKTDYSTKYGPNSVYAADIDGDGNVDILTANLASDSISVLKNNGDGTFAAKVDYYVGNDQSSIYATDIDGDGNVDILTSHGTSSNNVSVLKNNGNGTFAPKIDYPTGLVPWSVYASDIDGDGDIDILTANGASNNVSVLKNNGNGTFAAKVDYATGNDPRSVYASDIDGDGVVDVVTANDDANTISVLKGTSNRPYGGTFTVSPNSGIGRQTNFTLSAEGWLDPSEPLTYQFGYIDSSGNSYPLTLYTPQPNTAIILPAGDPRNNFLLTVFVNIKNASEGVTHATAVVQVLPPTDVNETVPPQNAQSVPTTAQLTCIFSLPVEPASFSSGINVLSSDGILYEVNIIDIDAGGTKTRTRNPIVQKGGTNAITADSATGFIITPTTPFKKGSVITVDISSKVKNTKGESIAPYLYTFTVATSPSPGTFASPVSYQTGLTPNSVAAADVDGDGNNDLVVTNGSSNTVSILKNNGDGTFAPKVDYPTGKDPLQVFVADVDGDHKPDLCVVNASDSSISILKNTGNGTFAAKVDYRTGGFPVCVYAADMDGDLDVDLVVSNDGFFQGNTISILKNNGDGTFATKVDYQTGKAPGYLYVADLDGDGDFDIAVPNIGDSSVSILMNNGNGTFRPRVDYPTAVFPFSVCVSDVDGDGDNDLIAVSGGDSNNVSILMNNGNGTFAPKVTYSAGEPGEYVVASDLDGDGDADLVVSKNATSSLGISIFKNNGNGTFANRVDYQTNSNPNVFAVADLNGDGVEDVAFPNYNTAEVSVLRGNKGTYSLTINATNGTVTKFPDQTDYAPNTGLVITAVPNPGYKFVRWSGDLTSANNPDSIVMTKDKTINAIFTSTAKFRTFSSSYATDFSAKPSKLTVKTKKVGTTKVPYLVTNAGLGLRTTLENFFLKRNGVVPSVTVGVNLTGTDALKTHGWLYFKTSSTLGKFLDPRNTGTSYPIDSVTHNNPMKGSKRTGKSYAKAITPVRSKLGDGNELWGEATVFKVNLLASQLNILPHGFGNITFDTTITLFGKSLKDSTLAYASLWLDSLETFWNEKNVYTSTWSVHNESLATQEFGNFAKVLRRINDGFYREMDTTGFGTGTPLVTSDTLSIINVQAKNAYALYLVGSKSVADAVSFLKYTPTAKEALLELSSSEGIDEPLRFGLQQNYPNPFNPLTVIGYSLSVNSIVSLKVYDVLGREVTTLINNETMEEGAHEISFNASSLSSGVYFYRITAKGENGKVFTQAKKLVLMK